MSPDFDRRATLTELFSPATPITKQQLFAGRQRQMDILLQAINQAGQHAVIYGERGVGKTSLAATLAENLRGTDIAVLANCDSTDSFSTVWRKALKEVKLVHEVPGIGFSPETTQAITTAADRLPPRGKVTPDDVRHVLAELSRIGEVVVFIDEFDRLASKKSKSLFADSIKHLSDRGVPATLVLVGVADNVDELIEMHGSVERITVQIPMPRMSTAELGEIVDKVELVEMSIDDDAKERITHLSQGLPHYTHLLALGAALSADDRDAKRITMQNVERAADESMQNIQASIIGAYQRATLSTRETLYPQVVLACALTQGDALGYFSAGDVRAPLSEIMGRPYGTPAFSQHLTELSDSESERGPILQKIGSARKLRFRFINPLLQPYVVMKGIADGLIDGSTLQRLAA